MNQLVRQQTIRRTADFSRTTTQNRKYKTCILCFTERGSETGKIQNLSRQKISFKFPHLTIAVEHRFSQQYRPMLCGSLHMSRQGRNKRDLTSPSIQKFCFVAAFYKHHFPWAHSRGLTVTVQQKRRVHEPAVGVAVCFHVSEDSKTQNDWHENTARQKSPNVGGFRCEHQGLYEMKTMLLIAVGIFVCQKYILLKKLNLDLSK